MTICQHYNKLFCDQPIMEIKLKSGMTTVRRSVLYDSTKHQLEQPIRHIKDTDNSTQIQLNLCLPQVNIQ